MARRAIHVMPRQKNHEGFALVLTLVLVALLTLALLGLGSLVRVSSRVASTGTAQIKARQNASLGLSAGMAELQRVAGEDGRITAMAGVTGVAANAASTTRNWCGVWRVDGSFVGWLTSGAQSTDTAQLSVGVPEVTLVGEGSGGAGAVGASAAHSEHVIAGKLPISVTETLSSPGVRKTIGTYAFLVTDEGVK